MHFVELLVSVYQRRRNSIRRPTTYLERVNSPNAEFARYKKQTFVYFHNISTTKTVDYYSQNIEKQFK